MATRSTSAPVLTKLSPYESSPKYGFAVKWKQPNVALSNPASNKYDIRNLVDKTSKYGELTRPCSFSTAKRFTSSKAEGLGPGTYTLGSTLSQASIGFGVSTRPPINGIIRQSPGPGECGNPKADKRGETPLSERTCSVGGRHGWFYDNPQASLIPGPGAYKPGHDQTELPVPTVTVGKSNRPPIASHLGVDVKNVLGPGQYPIPTTLCGNVQMEYPPAYSFTRASDRTKVKKLKDDPPMVLQVTQFGATA